MFFRRLFFLFFVLLFIGTLISMNGRNQSQYHAGYAQGYIAGQQSMQPTEGDAAIAPPPAPYYPPTYHPGFSFFGFFLKGFILFFGIMFLIGLLFGHRRRYGMHGRGWQKWQHEWHQAGHKPPWYDDVTDEPIMKA